MFDTDIPAPEAPAPERQTCDLCIVGAGLAGLNALAAAVDYLAPDARVILIDRNARCGGMWNETYDFIRLHQPHPMFTAGDIPWKWSRPKDYLATGREVMDHFAHCTDVLRDRVDLVERYGVTFEGCEEIVTEGPSRVRITCRAPEGPLIIEATRMINAIGFNVPAPAPLAFSSRKIVSTTPQRLLTDLPEGADGNIFVVGGGKTGMDVIGALLDQRPGLRPTLINGKGTVFGNRDLFAPKGHRRWWRGHLMLTTFADIAMRFDGTNETSVFAYFRKRFTTGPQAGAEQFFFGLLSEAESADIANGLSRIIGDYLTDIVDTDAGPQMVFRSGMRLPVAPGSVFVNCTGHMLRDPQPYVPYISRHGAILTISARSAIHILSSVSAYFLTHLFFLGKLPDARLYALDLEHLLTKGRKVWQMSGMMLSFMNTLVLLKLLPLQVVDKCALDLDRWFPLPRRLAALIAVKWHERRYLRHCRRILDRVRDRHGIRCGALA